MTKMSESYESGNKKRNQAPTRKLKVSVSYESGNKNKIKKQDKPKKVTVSYESVRKNQEVGNMSMWTVKKGERFVREW